VFISGFVYFFVFFVPFVVIDLNPWPEMSGNAYFVD